MSRQTKDLYLPLEGKDADLLGLKARLSFQSVVQGNGTRASAVDMASIALLCEVLTEDGHGVLPLQTIRDAQNGVHAVIDAGEATGLWAFPEQLIAQLRAVVNEYDRQMHETRLQAIVHASHRVDRILKSREAQAQAAHAEAGT